MISVSARKHIILLDQHVFPALRTVKFVVLLLNVTFVKVDISYRTLFAFHVLHKILVVTVNINF